MLACSQDPVRCGPGTTLDGGLCIPATNGSGGHAGEGGAGGDGSATSASSSGSSTTSSGSGGSSDLASLVPKGTFEQLFLHRGTAPCTGAFYTYETFLQAAEDHPAFVGTGSDDDRKRELAAFFANIAHETNGGWPAAPDGPYSWGLCWVTEGGTIDSSLLADYCAPSAEWPCAPGKKYFGRGPIQLSYNYNYGQAGAALGIDLLSDPDKVANDPTTAFRTALWFWMTPQPPKPSCHDVMTGKWTPSAEDQAGGRMPGFGMTINIINGGLECGKPTPEEAANRVGYYEHFAQILGVDPGMNLTCDTMQHY